MKTEPVNVRFRCQATRCECEVVVEGKMTTRPDGPTLYEYNVATVCPKCGHRLLGLHRRLGETPVTAGQ